MSASSTVSEKVQDLLSQRATHEQAIAIIDHRLAQIAEILGAPITARRRPGRPRKGTSMTPPVLGRPRKRTRMRYAVSGEQTILNFIKDHKNPTTKDIKAHWASESRKGSADNVLSQMVKAKKIKRTPLEGERGSRYASA